MIVEPFAADPAFPGLEVAGDGPTMRRLLGEHLRPSGRTAYTIESCTPTRVRYRKGARCVLQYVLDLRDPATGASRAQWVAGVMYAGGKTRRKWEKAARYVIEVPDADPAFEPFAYVPELDMLVEVFPYDRRLPGLPLLMSGASPELEAAILRDYGTGTSIEGWNVEPVRYRAELGATARITLRVADASGHAAERRLYAKVYHDSDGEATRDVLEALRDRGAARFSVGRPVAYLEERRILVQEETPGVALRDALLADRDADRAVRRAAVALADLHLCDVDPPRLHPVANEARALERTGRLLRWACPHLEAEVDETVRAVVDDLVEVRPVPTHRDLKLDHILLDGDRVGFVDFDSFAGANPLLDTANVMTHLGGLSLLFPGFEEERGRNHERNFAEQYFERVPGAWSSGLRAHHAGATLKMAVGFFRRREAGWPRKIEVLLERARASLAAGIV